MLGALTVLAVLVLRRVLVYLPVGMFIAMFPVVVSLSVP
jgi:hypothetical protein